MSSTQDRQEAVNTLARLITGIPVAMLTTRLPDGSLTSRPMVSPNEKFTGDLWFFTPKDDPKVREIEANPQVNVCFASPDNRQFVSVSGPASIVEDRKRVELHWTKECARWLPIGPDDENLALIKVDVERAEYWDDRSSGMVSIFSMGGGQTAPRKHEKIDWN